MAANASTALSIRDILLSFRVEEGRLVYGISLRLADFSIKKFGEYVDSQGYKSALAHLLKLKEQGG